MSKTLAKTLAKKAREKELFLLFKEFVGGKIKCNHRKIK